LDSSAPTGVFYPQQTIPSLVAAIREFESRRDAFSTAACRANAERFSEPRFRSEFGSLIQREWNRHRAQAVSAPWSARRPH
jgi:hypothetical protein